MSKVVVVYLKRRGPKVVAKVSPSATYERTVPEHVDLHKELKQARIVSEPRYVSSVYKWGA